MGAQHAIPQSQPSTAYHQGVGNCNTYG